MESDRPYFTIKSTGDKKIICRKGEENCKTSYLFNFCCADTEIVKDFANLVHENALKAERERNWKTVVELCGVNPAERRPCIEKVDRKFWCPVCLCADSIRGGQDGK